MYTFKKRLPGGCEFQNRGLARYTLKCLGTIYLAACAAALQSVFEIRPRPRAVFQHIHYVTSFVTTPPPQVFSMYTYKLIFSLLIFYYIY